jgi:hypothetical protein
MQNLDVIRVEGVGSAPISFGILIAPFILFAKRFLQKGPYKSKKVDSEGSLYILKKDSVVVDKY